MDYTDYKAGRVVVDKISQEEFSFDLRFLPNGDELLRQTRGYVCGVLAGEAAEYIEYGDNYLGGTDIQKAKAICKLLPYSTAAEYAFAKNEAEGILIR